MAKNAIAKLWNLVLRSDGSRYSKPPIAVPTLVATANSHTQVTVTASGASSSLGSIAGYLWYRNGVQLNTVASASPLIDTGLQPSTQYTYTAIAVDSAANQSAMSSSAVVSTNASPDVTAPSVPSSVSASVLTPSSIRVVWLASTDSGGSGLAGYRVQRSYDGVNGWAQVAQQSGLTFDDTNLVGGTTYYYRVAAYDNGGNVSAFSSVTSATTASTAGAPFIIATDFTAGPTSGGDGNNGAFLTIYGLNLGNFSEYGVPFNNFVTIGGVQVANYRAMYTPKSPWLAAMGVKCLTVQVGALAGLTPGTAYPVTVSVDGSTPTNSVSGGTLIDFFGDPLTFTPQPGSIIFVDPVSGNNANAGTFASPLKDLQTSAGTGGAFKIHTGANTLGGIKPGTHVYLRGGTYNTVGVNGRIIDFFRITGTAPSGAADRGPICMAAYPGAAGANSPETVVLSGSNLNGNDSARASETSTLYGGFTGWCQHIQISNIKVAVDASQGSDHGPFNTQNHGQNWRIVNCEATWPSTVSSSQGRSAGIEGSPVNGRFHLMYIHDIYGAGSEANTQHGIYMDGFGSGAGNVAQGNIFGLPDIRDITFGNGIQFFDGVNGAGMNNNKVICPRIERVAKHGLNIADNTKSCSVVNPLLIDCGEAGIRISTSGATGANAIVITNPTLYGWGLNVASRYAISHESTSSGTMRIENGIFMQKPGHAANSYGFVRRNSNELTISKCRWWDPDGRLSAKPSEDSTGSYGDPGFVNAGGGDFTLQSGSACINAGNVPSITRSYGLGLNPAPQGAAHDLGAYERA